MAAVARLHHQDDAPVFPDEITTEILSWLPVMSLVRFRCVCKDWNSLFSNPAFIKLHLQRSPKTTQTIFTFSQPRGSINVEGYAICSKPRLFESPASAIEECNPHYRHVHRYNLFGVCNGLACLIHSQVGSGYSAHWFLYLNPATRIQSPSPGLVLRTTEYYCILGKVDLKYGFGYDDSSDTYKAVVVLMDDELQNLEVKVHCLGEAGWTHALTCPVFPIIGDDCGLFAGGHVNWLALKRPCSYYELETLVISSFDGWDTLISSYDEWGSDITKDLAIFSYDIKDNTHKYLSTPSDLTKVRTHEPCIGVLKGCLCLSYDDGKGLVIWIMREFGNEESWTKLLNLRYEGSQTSSPWPMIPLCMSENEEVFLLLNNKVNGFVVYNGAENRIDYTEDFTENRFGFVSHDYAESLVLPYRN